MKKILVILNAGHMAQHVNSSAIDISRKTSSVIYAVFINDLKTSQDQDYPFPNDLSLAGTNLSTTPKKLENRKRIESELQVFKDECEGGDVSFSFEIDEVVSVRHLLHISSFSDLIIADTRTESDEFTIKDLLIGAHAPVLLVSREWKTPESVILCYDGKLSSTYAIKMFSYVFPELTNLPTKVVYVSSSRSDQLPHEIYFKDWLGQHFPNLERDILVGNAQEEIVNYIHPHSDSKIVVMGSYGENTLSRIFHTSLSNAVRTQTYGSLFITHE
jgi:hypothetical protein